MTIHKKVKDHLIAFLSKLYYKNDNRYNSIFPVPLKPLVVRRILKENNILYSESPVQYSWWYSSFINDRNSRDALSRWALMYITQNIDKSAKIFMTGCGTGWFLLLLADKGYKNLYGSDIMPECINALKDFSCIKHYIIDVWEDDGLNPSRIPAECDVVFVLHWIYSAWAGNYTDKNNGYKDMDSNYLLDNFFAKYHKNVKKGGLIFIELIDQLSDYYNVDVQAYPIRHKYDDVNNIASKYGFEIIDRCVGFAHKVRVLYVLQKTLIIDKS